MATPFDITMFAPGSSDNVVAGVWRMNSIALNTETTIPLGGNAITSLASLDSDLPVGVGGAVLNRTAYTTNPGAFSTNWYHLSEMYSKYRVIKFKLNFSLVYDNQPASSDQTVGMSRFASLCLFATDDLDAINSSAKLAKNFVRPYCYNHRHIAVKTIGNGHIRPSKVSITRSVRSLIRDRSVNIVDAYSGDATRAAAADVGKKPGYTTPANHVYAGFTMTPYGQAPNATWLENQQICSGYITVTWWVEFFRPHDNADFYGPV